MPKDKPTADELPPQISEWSCACKVTSSHSHTRNHSCCSLLSAARCCRWLRCFAPARPPPVRITIITTASPALYITNIDSPYQCLMHLPWGREGGRGGCLICSPQTFLLLIGFIWRASSNTEPSLESMYFIKIKSLNHIHRRARQDSFRIMLQYFQAIHLDLFKRTS